MITTQHNLAGYYTKWNAIKEDLYVSLKSKTQKSNKIIWTVIVLCLSFIDIAMKFEWNDWNRRDFYILLQWRYFQVQTCFILFYPILDCNNKKYPNWKFLNPDVKINNNMNNYHSYSCCTYCTIWITQYIWKILESRSDITKVAFYYELK